MVSYLETSNDPYFLPPVVGGRGGGNYFPKNAKWEGG